MPRNDYFSFHFGTWVCEADNPRIIYFLIFLSEQVATQQQASSYGRGQLVSNSRPAPSLCHTCPWSGFTFNPFKPPPSLFALATTSKVSLSAIWPRLYVARLADGRLSSGHLSCNKSTSPVWLIRVIQSLNISAKVLMTGKQCVAVDSHGHFGVWPAQQLARWPESRLKLEKDFSVVNLRVQIQVRQKRRESGLQSKSGVQ